jgi:hypothetical protein
MDRSTIEVNAKSSPIPCSKLMGSWSRAGATITTTTGYKAVKGITTDAFPPFFIAA